MRNLCAGIGVALLLSSCASIKPEVVTRTEIVRPRVPSALLKPCPKAWSKTGGPATTGDFVQRGDVNAARLNACAAQVDGIRRWDAQ